MQGLLAAPQTGPVKTRISRAIGYLKTQMNAAGGVNGGGPTNTPNANSTGLAVLAFSTTGHPNAGHPRPAVPALAALRLHFPRGDAGRHRVRRGGFANARSEGDAATLSDQDLRSTTQATLGFAPVPLYKVTNVGAKPSAPAFTCP